MIEEFRKRDSEGKPETKVKEEPYKRLKKNIEESFEDVKESAQEFKKKVEGKLENAKEAAK